MWKYDVQYWYSVYMFTFTCAFDTLVCLSFYVFRSDLCINVLGGGLSRPS